MKVLVVMPSWVGDAVMATPALRLVREALPGAFVGVLCRPGIDQLLAGHRAIDQVHVEHAKGVMGPKFAAAKVRPMRYDAALLLTNSFSTALVTRIAGIPRRVGYDRDGRGFLLTDKLAPVRRDAGGYEIVSAVTYYWDAAREFVRVLGAAVPTWAMDTGPRRTPPTTQADLGLPDGVCMELAVRDEDRLLADRVWERAGLDVHAAPVMLNPGGNNPEKRWPAERFAAIADHVAREYGAPVLVNGSPGERELCEAVAIACTVAKPVVLAALAAELGTTLGTLKAIIARCSVMVSNDTGPRHIALALGVPTVSLFGPTDHRWTIVPTSLASPEWLVPADPTLPADQTANDHPERCEITRIDAQRVREAVDAAFGHRRAMLERGRGVADTGV